MLATSATIFKYAALATLAAIFKFAELATLAAIFKFAELATPAKIFKHHLQSLCLPWLQLARRATCRGKRIKQ